MSTAELTSALAEQQHIVLDDVSWSFYERVLEELDDRPLRITFFRGRMEIMSPLPSHEKWKKRIARLIELMALELDIDIETVGSATLREELASAGLEPDECYYIAHADRVRGKERLDLAIDPPPDLAVEVDISARSIKREPVYQALGVPELWRFGGRSQRFLQLTSNGYAPIEKSRAFDFLSSDTFQQWLQRMEGEPVNVVLRDLQAKWRAQRSA